MAETSEAFASGRHDWRKNHDKARWGGGDETGYWLADILNRSLVSLLSRTLSSLRMRMLRRMRKIQKVGGGGDPSLQMIWMSKVRGFLGGHSGLHPFLSPFPPGSSDEDEDDDGVSAATFLKKKSEAPSGESRKFLKKMEVRARARLRAGLFAVNHSWVSWEKKRLPGPCGWQGSCLAKSGLGTDCLLDESTE